jgi:C_GCAxxG_C_C family probable redox protein
LLALAVGVPACLAAPASAGPPGAEGPLPLTAEDRVFLAVSRFEQGFHCAQAVLGAYTDGPLTEEAALRMGAALAGGSTVGGECGAVAAGYLVLGLKHGGTLPTFGDVEKEKALFDRIRRFALEFRKRHGTLACRELLGVDVFDPEGLAEGRRRGLFRERCPRHVRDVVEIVEAVSAEPAPPAAGERP